MAEQKVKLGFIGAGFFGQLAHISAFAELADCELTALCSKADHRREAVAEKFGFKRSYGSHQELLADTEVEAVVIVTPRPLLAPLALAALEAGKHVLSEKPMAGSVEQGVRLVEAAKRAGVVYSVGFMKRFDAGVVAAKKCVNELMQTGSLGALTFARAHLFGGRAYVDKDGAVALDERSAIDQGLAWATAPAGFTPEAAALFARLNNSVSHNVNLLRYLLNEKLSVQSASFVDEGAQLISFAVGKAAAILEYGELTHEGWDEVTEIFFKKGCLRIETPAPLKHEASATVKLYRDNREEIIADGIDSRWAFARQAQAFLDAVHGGDNLCSGADSILELQLLEQAFKLAVWR